VSLKVGWQKKERRKKRENLVVHARKQKH
jgi:hypothetical protein